jgi:hypothetical protein
VGLASLMSVAVFLTFPSRSFRAKGNADSPVAVELTCVDASADSCPVGSTLLFGMANMSSRAYLEAYAEHQGTGERVWYFSPETETPLLPPAAGPQAATRGIRVGSEHTPGNYVVRVFLLQEPLPRAALLSGHPSGVLRDARLPLVVVARKRSAASRVSAQ